MDWIYAFASVRGTSHEKTSYPCQDSCICETARNKKGELILIAVASDGAGSSEYGDIGARLLCNILKEEIIDFLEGGSCIGGITRETAAGWIESFREEALAIAVDRGRPIGDFACTLLAAIVGLAEAVYFQIGDGAIVVLSKASPEGFRCIFWPQRGEYANTTCFTTDKYALKRHLLFKKEEDDIINIGIFTDGIQQLSLHYESRTPFGGFFNPLFRTLNALRGRSTEEINILLEAFLRSEKLNSRTDDDKTLIIAERPRI